MPGTQIVLGLDDSPASIAALRWAAQHARRTGSFLRAIHVLPLLTTLAERLTTDIAGQGVVPPDLVNESSRIRISHTFEAGHPNLGWQLDFVEGDAGPVLVAESEYAHLLVIGTREHTGLTRIVLGSVSHYCLSRAHCPVVAVPSTPVHAQRTAPAWAWAQPAAGGSPA